MSQSNYIAAFLIIGFVVFITLKGELNVYRNILISSSNPLATGN